MGFHENTATLVTWAGNCIELMSMRRIMRDQAGFIVSPGVIEIASAHVDLSFIFRCLSDHPSSRLPGVHKVCFAGRLNSISHYPIFDAECTRDLVPVAQKNTKHVSEEYNAWP